MTGMMENGTVAMPNCVSNEFITQYYYEIPALSGMISIFLLSFCFDRQIDNCQRVVSLVPPIHLFEYAHRWDYICQFGAMALAVSKIFTGFDTPSTVMAMSEDNSTVPSYVTGTINLLRTFEISVAGYPVFASLSVEDSVFVFVIGFFHSALACCLDLYIVIQCPDPIPQLLPYLMVALMLPSIVCRGWVTCKLLFKMVLAMCRGQWQRARKRELQVDIFQTKRVRELLQPRSLQVPDDNENIITKIKQLWYEYFYEHSRQFKYPNRMLCTMSVVFFIVYQMTLFSYAIAGNIDHFARQVLGDSVIIMALERLIVPVNIKENASLIADMIFYSWLVPGMVCMVLRVWNIVLTLSNYRVDTMFLWRGDRSFLPRRYTNDGTEALSQTLRFAGYQIAYVLWAMLLLNVVGFILLLAVCFLLILPLMFGIQDIMWWLLAYLVIPGAVGLAIFYINAWSSRLVHVRSVKKRESSARDYKTVFFINMSFLPVSDYLFFLLNVSTGLFSSLWRLLFGFLLGLFYLGRLDQCIFMPNFASWDKGYNAYVGMLMVEEHLSHPVLRVFCGLLLDHRQAHDQQNSEEEQSGDFKSTVQQTDAGLASGTTTKQPQDGREALRDLGVSRRTRLRWHLFYTLVRNPSLAHLRRQGPTEVVSEEPNLLKHFINTVKSKDTYALETSSQIAPKGDTPVLIKAKDHINETYAGSPNVGFEGTMNHTGNVYHAAEGNAHFVNASEDSNL